jgi:hypothetical protein
MVRSCESVGRSGGKLDLVRTFVACIDHLAWFVKFGCVVPGCSWWWFSEPSLGDFFGLFSGPFSWGFDEGYLWEPFMVLWAVIPVPNP